MQQATQQLDGRGLGLWGQCVELRPYALALHRDRRSFTVYGRVSVFMSYEKYLRVNEKYRGM